MNCIVSSTEMLKITHTLTRHTALLLKSFLKHWLKWPRYARIRKVNGPKSNPPNHRSIAATRCNSLLHRSAPKCAEEARDFQDFSRGPANRGALAREHRARGFMIAPREKDLSLFFSPRPSFPAPRSIPLRLHASVCPCVASAAGESEYARTRGYPGGVVAPEPRRFSLLRLHAREYASSSARTAAATVSEICRWKKDEGAGNSSLFSGDFPLRGRETLGREFWVSTVARKCVPRVRQVGETVGSFGSGVRHGRNSREGKLRVCLKIGEEFVSDDSIEERCPGSIKNCYY